MVLLSSDGFIDRARNVAMQYMIYLTPFETRCVFSRSAHSDPSDSCYTLAHARNNVAVNTVSIHTRTNLFIVDSADSIAMQ